MTLIEQADDFLRDHQHFHSEFQIDHFIASASGPTEWARYRQVLREIETRRNGLLSAEDERERTRVRIDELRATLWLWRLWPWARRRREIELRQAERSLVESRRTTADSERELRRFIELAQALREAIGPVTPEKRAALDAEMWAENARAMVVMDMYASGRLSPSSIKMLRNLPNDLRLEVLTDAQCRTPEEAAVKLCDMLDVPRPAGMLDSHSVSSGNGE